ncbi:pectin lyase fold/virulence factor [Mycena galericulata]|nr:pectin lyase fold/virulence factor [Mycena galericulata]
MHLTLASSLLALALPALGFRFPFGAPPTQHGAPPAHASCTLTAAGAGRDDAPQFLRAMHECSTVLIPPHTTLNVSTRLNMTGLSNKHLNLQGTVRFNPDIPYWSGNGFSFPFQTQVTFWILGGKNIVVSGGGTLDGAGQAWYDAFAANASLLRPITLTLFQATDVLVQDITMLNSPEWFNFINEGKNVTFANVALRAASTSANGPSNTDGWDVYRSDQITLRDSVIDNGDDCVSFKPNTTNTLVSNLNCTGSHGISVGSLGQFAGVFDIVENVTSVNIRMSTNAQNGARIKAFAGPGVGSGSVKNVTFSHFIETAVGNPVIIDQCYETTVANCTAFPSNVFIQDIFFNSISGTSTGATVASLECSPGARCSDINVNNISLSPPSGSATYVCQNVNLTGNAAALFPACTVT